MPQQKTKPVRKIHGSHAFHAGPVAAGVTVAAAAGAAAAVTSSSFGFQNRMSTRSATMDTAALTMSTSHGP